MLFFGTLYAVSIRLNPRPPPLPNLIRQTLFSNILCIFLLFAPHCCCYFGIWRILGSYHISASQTSDTRTTAFYLSLQPSQHSTTQHSTITISLHNMRKFKGKFSEKLYALLFAVDRFHILFICDNYTHWLFDIQIQFSSLNLFVCFVWRYEDDMRNVSRPTSCAVAATQHTATQPSAE